MFNVVLVEPEIPQNSGSIVRLCACTGSRLFLVEPLGYQLDDSRLKRAGLDYWERAVYRVVPSLDGLLERFGSERFFFFTTKLGKTYTRHAFRSGDFLVFGRESRGLPATLLREFADQALTIPMPGRTRSLNLANSVAVALYEGLRQVEGWPTPTTNLGDPATHD
ncbi:MAG: tRNA (cytidine(34)-2'-O)-methyltransferase [bacterium]|jgi:tRNA (cytidine/uridine-2'-O-)-methyltransferase|nr:tRNA (cytidine(34)-2'-O)-methyltransferase [bacterium]